MSGSMSRRKGAGAERDVVNWLTANGFPHAERRLSGAPDDRGDITGIPGLVLEVKNHARLELAAWTDQLTDELDNANTDIGALIVKRRGRTNPADWYAVMPAHILARLLRDAGWGEPR